MATGDPEGAVGHFAPVGGYDEATDRVLIFDPDRRWYEPYWISAETLLAAMATRDPDTGQSRGLLYATLSAKEVDGPKGGGEFLECGRKLKKHIALPLALMF